MWTISPPEPGKSCKSACLFPVCQVEISLIPDHCILFWLVGWFPVTKKSLTTPDTLNVGNYPAVTIELRLAKFVDVPIK